MRTPMPLPETASSARRPNRLRRAGCGFYRGLIGAWKFLAGAAFTQSFIGSILVTGWTYRAARRAVHKQWWRQAGGHQPAGFREFVRGSSFSRGMGGWPNWVLESNRTWVRAHRIPGWAGVRALARALSDSLWLNLRIGALGILNTWVLTLPGCALMLFSWYAGWQNSFNKGYEQAAVGPVTGLSGILLFVLAMYYVPLAQLRQASTENWRAFYEFRTVWTLARKKWLACLGLALLFTAFSVPVTVLKTVPAFFTQMNPSLGERPPLEALRFAKWYYFAAGFVVFTAFIALRLAAARVYASALLSCVRSGALPEDALAESEWETLRRLDLLEYRPAPSRHFLVRTIAWCGTRLGRVATGAALFVVWFTFTAQIYISEFFLKSPQGRGWLNQPLVQLPWFNYIPPSLKESAKTKSEPVEPGSGKRLD